MSIPDLEKFSAPLRCAAFDVSGDRSPRLDFCQQLLRKSDRINTILKVRHDIVAKAEAVKI
ncbi:hypothetical protein [Baaleninema simplex]|uniref:hypothetical protein n=1 Tax=Baaleninema simplex TaxID=2862350 RepID=UPI0011817BFC|nr:hypothetical protein [Baaleninema simplex]